MDCGLFTGVEVSYGSTADDTYCGLFTGVEDHQPHVAVFPQVSKSICK